MNKFYQETVGKRQKCSLREIQLISLGSYHPLDNQWIIVGVCKLNPYSANIFDHKMTSVYYACCMCSNSHHTTFMIFYHGSKQYEP